MTESRRHNRAGHQGDPELAQFFTPAPVGELIWLLLESWAGKQLPGVHLAVDPAAGRGHLLDIAARRLGVENVCGVEMDSRLVAQRVGLAEQVHFEVGDGLVDHPPQVAEGRFDLVIGNPPFGPLGAVTGSEVSGRGCFAVVHLAGVADPVKTAGELLFLERALNLVGTGGLIALVMPQGFTANLRLQKVRDWVLDRARVVGVAELPAGTFRGPGLHACTSVVVLQKGAGAAEQDVMLLRSSADSLMCGLDAMAAVVRGCDTEDAELVELPSSELRGRRWDPRYWIGRKRCFDAVNRHRLRSLGDFIVHLTYGPIVTGSRPAHEPSGTPVVRQGDFLESGLDLTRLLRVAPGSAHDPQRSRVCAGDLLMPRSGAGSLGRNRMAVYDCGESANVGCFVDLIRLEGIDPYYVWLFLKSGPGRGQIEALINGVGTPNINFAEIRSLRIPLAGLEEQARWQRGFAETVLPCHRRRLSDPEQGAAADRALHDLVNELEASL